MRQLFVVRRGDWRDGQPCDDATREVVARWDRRTCRTIEEFDAKFAHTRQGAWRDHGEEHDRIWIDHLGKKCIRRRFWDPEWVLRCDLGALLRLVESYGEIGIEDEGKFDYPVLRIGRDSE